MEQPADLDPAFRAAFAQRDGPTLVECVEDPDEAPLPPRISTEHAINFMKALARGQEHPIRIATTMFRDKVDELLVQGIGGIPGPESTRREHDPPTEGP